MTLFGVRYTHPVNIANAKIVITESQATADPVLFLKYQNGDADPKERINTLSIENI
ncbi:MAG: hypothetical protein IPG53_15680 [Ignavibacteriales bacterium]|nr:hypothetical protein [Ignavibacteriales bacterium]